MMTPELFDQLKKCIRTVYNNTDIAEDDKQEIIDIILDGMNDTKLIQFEDNSINN